MGIVYFHSCKGQGIIIHVLGMNPEYIFVYISIFLYITSYIFIQFHIFIYSMSSFSYMVNSNAIYSICDLFSYSLCLSFHVYAILAYQVKT